MEKISNNTMQKLSVRAAHEYAKRFAALVESDNNSLVTSHVTCDDNALFQFTKEGLALILTQKKWNKEDVNAVLLFMSIVDAVAYNEDPSVIDSAMDYNDIEKSMIGYFSLVDLAEKKSGKVQSEWRRLAAVGA